MTDHITYERLLEICREYSAHDCFSDANKRFAQRVLERMFYRGKHGSLISICMCSTNGCITLPEDVEYVEKAKINGITQSVMSHWYTFAASRRENYHEGCAGLQHLPNKYFTQYDAPWDHFIPVVKSRSHSEDEEAFFNIQGISLNGEKVFLRHKGATSAGQTLPLLNEKFVESSVPFTKIIGVEKSATKGYVDLFAKNPITKELVYLSGYSPREERPRYTRIKVNGCDTDEKMRIELLARLKILPNYECNELVPVVGLDVLESICQEIRLQKSNNFQNAVAAGAVAKELIRDENNYKYGTDDDSLDVVDFGDSSGGVW